MSHPCTTYPIDAQDVLPRLACLLRTTSHGRGLSCRCETSAIPKAFPNVKFVCRLEVHLLKEHNNPDSNISWEVMCFHSFFHDEMPLQAFTSTCLGLVVVHHNDAARR